MIQSNIKTCHILAIISALGAASMAKAAVTPITYAGPDSGLWSASSNWSPAVVPANSGSNSYSVAIAAHSVVFNISGTTSINDLTLSNNLTLNPGCSLSASGQIALTTATVTCNGGNFTAGGPAAAAADLSVVANNGAKLALPVLTQIADSSYPFGSMQANGASSLLSLPQVTTITFNNIFTGVQASAGGKVDLHSLLSITSTTVNSIGMTANGGTIDVSNLAVGTTNSASISLWVSNSGTVLWGSPTSLHLIDLTVTGAGNMIDVSHVTSATDFNVNASGGAQVALPLLTQIADSSYPFGSMQANGAGSMLSLPQVTTITFNNIFTGVQASGGGKVDLHGLLSITSTTVNSIGMTANGGTIDVSNLAVGTTNSASISLSVSNSGTVFWGSPTSLHLIDLTVTGTANTIDVSHVATATDFNVNASGGAHVALPLLTQIADSNYPFGSMQANGTGSMLSLPQVTTITFNNIFTGVQASAGGNVDLHSLLTVTSTTVNSMDVNANGGTIDLPNLAVGMSNSAAMDFSLSNSGVVSWGSPTSLHLIGLTVTGTGNTIDVSHVTAARDFSASASGGAQVALPLLTQIANSSYPFGSLQASGTGSVLDLSHVTTIAINSIFTSVQANAGGLVNLHNLLSVTSTGNFTMGLNATGGTIDISSLGRLLGSVQVSGGGAVLLSGSGSMSGRLTVSGGSSAGTQGLLEFSGAMGTMEFTDSLVGDTDLLVGGGTAGNPAILDFRLGNAADRFLLDAGKLVVNPGGATILITPEPGIAAGTYDLIDFRSGQASGLANLVLGTTSLPGYSLALQSTPSAEQLVVTAVPEPAALALLAGLMGGIAVFSRRSLRRLK